MSDWLQGREKEINATKNLNDLRENDQYLLDKAKKQLQIWSTRCVTVCIVILTIGFAAVFSKYIFFLCWYNEFDSKTEQILGYILDWTMKIIIGWLAKSFFEKKSI